MLFAQSISWRWMFSKLEIFDRMFLRQTAKKAITHINDRIANWTQKNSPHPFDLIHADEDEWALSSFGSCQLLGLLFPILAPGNFLMRLVDFDKALTDVERETIFTAYKELIQRHLYFERVYRNRGSNLRYLAKNPTFTLRLQTLLNTFSDAQVVVVVRNPYEAIPSMVSHLSSLSIIKN
jgi:hypothetical protein